MTLAQIGAAHGVHLATAGRWIEKAQKRLLSALRAGLSRRLRIPRSEVDSILRLVRQHLNVSLSGMLE